MYFVWSAPKIVTSTLAAAALLLLFSVSAHATQDSASAPKFQRYSESSIQAEAKRQEAVAQERQASAQVEQATKEMLIQQLEALRRLTNDILDAYREIRDAANQAAANIVRNA